MSRIWAMPSGETFSIKPIRELIERWIKHPCIDPFARNCHLADVTNDLDPETTADFHLDASDFLDNEQKLGHFYKCALFDPPYSPRQINELYKHVNMDKSVWSNSKLIGDIKSKLAPLIELHGIVMSFGWNSGGIGKKYGFEIKEILLVAHGGSHSDTICTVEEKI